MFVSTITALDFYSLVASSVGTMMMSFCTGVPLWKAFLVRACSSRKRQHLYSSLVSLYSRVNNMILTFIARDSLVSQP